MDVRVGYPQKPEYQQLSVPQENGNNFKCK